jgi:GTP-binding protein LepA
MSLCIENVDWLLTKRIDYRKSWIDFDMPLAEIVFDFMTVWKPFLRLCFFWLYIIGMRTSSLVKVDILLNATIVDALSSLMHTDNALLDR